jgi:N-acetylglutamate synthase
LIDRLSVERYAAEAWPATEAREEDGWLLRHTPGVPRRRSNSALPLAREEALLTALSRVEDFYAIRGMAIAVQVAPAEEYTALDALLAERGYRRDAATLVCTAPTDTVITGSRRAVPPEVSVVEHPARQWLDAYVALDGHDNSHEAADQVLSRVPGPAAYLSVERDDRVVGVGLIVAAPGCGGVFCMATHPGHRRQGIATGILHVGARWAAARGAEELYLQVMDDNHAARRLYDHVGFRVSHTYHYRLKP